MNTSINNETNFLSHSIDNVKNIKKNLSPMTFSNQNNTITNSNELINKNQNDSVSLYKKKNKEYLATIERLKASLKNETEAKNALHSEISKLKQLKIDLDDKFISSKKANDDIKNSFAKENNLSLVRIPYTEKDNINLEMLFGEKFLIK